MNHRNPIVTDNIFSLGANASLVQKAIAIAESGDCHEALRVLMKGSSASREVLNARGVCLMRIGKTMEAGRIFRMLVLPSGCTWMKPELPVIYRTNFTTALLLLGLPLGVRGALAEIKETDHPSVVRLRTAISEWEQGLTWWERWGWKLGLAPNKPMTIRFTPGEFLDSLPAEVMTDSKTDDGVNISPTRVAC